MNLHDKLANALDRATQVTENCIIQAHELSRADRELLIKNEWLQPIIKGWYMLVKPRILPGESSIWYANYWKFIARYLDHHFGKNYTLSTKSSIDLHTDISTIPSQIIVITPKGGSFVLKLPFQTSILRYSDPENIPEIRTEIKGIQIMELGYALCKITPTFFEKEPRKLEIALRLIRSPDELLAPIIKHGLQSAANRLIGAYRFLGDEDIANSIEANLKPFAVQLQVENPFGYPAPFTSSRVRSPYIARLIAMWKSYRAVVLRELTPPPNARKDDKQYFIEMEEIYKEDRN